MLAPWRPADDPTPPPAGRSSSTSRAAAAVTHVTLDGHPVDQLPPATELGGLPTYAKTSELALPDELGWTKGEDLPDLADAGTGDVRAVMLRMSGRNAYHPVLYRPQAEHAWVEVPEVVVAGPGDGRDGPPALSSAWFSPDRARVAFPQSDGAVVLDVTTGATEQVSTGEEIRSRLAPGRHPRPPRGARLAGVRDGRR